MRKIWKLLIVCFLCALCSLPDQVNAQTQPQKKITIEISNERLPSVLKRLEKISGYKILFTYDDVKKYTVSGVIKDKAIEQALDIILTDKPLEYHIENQFITITPKGPSKQAKIFNVKGVVISGDDGQPLIGATVLIKGTKTGVLTDIDGKFLMEKVPSNATLQFSYIGMTPQDLSPTPDMKVTLESDVQSLSEVVVTGMQRMDKRMFTGATAQLSADNVKIDGMPEISRALEGRAAGVSVQNVSGSFGTAPKIRVRGVEHATGVVVDEGRTVNPARIGFPKYGIYPFGFQHSYKFILAGCLSEGGENGSLCPLCKLLFFYLDSGSGTPVIKGFISGILSETGGFQRIAGLVSRIIGRRIDKSPVFPSVYLAPCFLYGDIVEGQQGTVFTERLETVGFREGFQHVSDLAFHIPLGYVHFAECPLCQPLFAVSGRV